jgi:hypothetical protein
MNVLFSLVLFFLLFPLFVAIWEPFWPFLVSIFVPGVFQWFGFGFLCCFVLGLAARGAVIEFTEVAVHEMIHAVVGIPFRGQPILMEASSEVGGQVGWASSGGGCLVAMAPYCFPLLTVLVLPLQLLGRTGIPYASQIADLLLGGTLAFHYVALATQLNPLQTESDLRYTGFPTAVAVALTSQLIWLVIVLGTVAGNLKAITNYFTSAILGIPYYYTSAWKVLLDFPTWVQTALPRI